MRARKGPCGHCKTNESPVWRKGSDELKIPVLCNACAIRYQRRGKISGR